MLPEPLNLALEFWNWYFFSDVPAEYLGVLRVVVFGLPLYMLLSRFYGHLHSIPEWFVSERYRGKQWSTLVVGSLTQRRVQAAYALGIGACLVGILGLVPHVAALVASLAIVVLNNNYAAVSTSDAEVLPYVVGMWTFLTVPESATVPVWTGLAPSATATVPALPFRLLQLYLCLLFFVNGLIKLPYWREWCLEKGVYADAKNWNTLSPRLDSIWPRIKHTRNVPGLWNAMGVVTIVAEFGVAIALVYPRALYLWWPGVLGLLVGNYLVRTTSFLLVPWLLLASFLPWLPEVAL